MILTHRSKFIKDTNYPSYWDQDLGSNNKHDFENDHERGSLGVEARGGNLEFNANFYEDISLQQTVNNRKEQVLGGYDLNLSSQVPYMPWVRFNYTDYEWKKI